MRQLYIAKTQVCSSTVPSTNYHICAKRPIFSDALLHIAEILLSSQKLFLIRSAASGLTVTLPSMDRKSGGRVRLNLFERRSAIMDTLRREGHTTVANLARAVDVSERTIHTDIAALSSEHPIRTVRGRYGGGVELASWYHPYASALSPKQEELLRRLKATLEGEDLIVLNSILTQFSPSKGYR